MDKLKPCPFCGGTRTAIHRGGPDGDISFITCGQLDSGLDGCGAVVSFRPNSTGQAAVSAWNRRFDTEVNHGD